MTEQVLHTAAIHRVLRTGQVQRRQTLPAYQNKKVPVPTARRAVNPDPQGSAFIFPLFNMRIQIKAGKFERKNTEKCKKL